MDTTRATEDLMLDALREHPRQLEFFTAASKLEIKELAADLRVRGQQEPIHVCPDGTIIRGHRRAAAAKLLGWKTIKALVRHDLADPSNRSTVAELITDNLMTKLNQEISEIGWPYG
jgi:ParB/RepB/Spo0J family partition protein